MHELTAEIGAYALENAAIACRDENQRLWDEGFAAVNMANGFTQGRWFWKRTLTQRDLEERFNHWCGGWWNYGWKIRRAQEIIDMVQVKQLKAFYIGEKDVELLKEYFSDT